MPPGTDIPEGYRMDILIVSIIEEAVINPEV
jgi:hypothetical protein